MFSLKPPFSSGIPHGVPWRLSAKIQHFPDCSYIFIFFHRPFQRFLSFVQVQMPWGTLWYCVIAVVQLGLTIGLLRGPLRPFHLGSLGSWPWLQNIMGTNRLTVTNPYHGGCLLGMGYKSWFSLSLSKYIYIDIYHLDE